MPEYDLRVQGSHYTSNDPEDPSGWRLRIEERRSGETLAEITLTPSQFQQMMSSSSVATSGFVSPNLDRVGKVMRHWQVQIPREITGYGRATSAEARVWAEANSPEPYDTLEVRKTNHGDVAVYRKWEES